MVERMSGGHPRLDDELQPDMIEAQLHRSG
jgi:hypothetical protein